MTARILDLWRIADTLPPEQARSQAESLVDDLDVYEAQASLKAMGFSKTPRDGGKIKRKIVEIIVEQAATGAQVRQIDQMFEKG